MIENANAGHIAPVIRVAVYIAKLAQRVDNALGSALAHAARGGNLQSALGGFLALATGFTIIGIAWAGERQNYWDAYHFSSLAWHSVIGGLVAFFAARSASLRGSEWGALLKGPSVVCLLLLGLVWLWTWCQPVQELQADIARYFFLRLHG